MKKVILILIAGLLLGGCTTAGGPGNVVKQEGDYIHLGWNGWYGELVDANLEQAAAYCSNRDKYAFNFYDYDYDDGNSAIFICSEKFLSKSPISNNTQTWSNYPEELREKEELARIREELAKSKEQKIKKKKIKVISMVDDAKSTCKDLGFNEGTEKFADCALKLYTQKVELAAEKKQTIVQSSSLSGGSVTIYDPVRDYNAAIKRGQGLINGTCTLGDLSNC
jgi:hypothetical protein